MKLWQLTVMGVGLCLLLCIGMGSAYTLNGDIRAISASPVYAKNVTLNGWSGGGNATYWFEYGRLPGMAPYPFKTENITGGGNFSIRVEGLPLIAQQRYYGRLCNETRCGLTELDWTMLDHSQAPVPTYARAYNTLMQGGRLNITNLPFSAMSPYTDLMGLQIVWGLVFAFLFFGYWIMQEDITIPVILGLITSGSILYGGTLSLGIPPEFVIIAQALMIVSVIGLVYTLLRKR